jgi:uncharacterized protein
VDNGSPEILCLGEAKWNTVMTAGHVERLATTRDLLRDHSRRSSDRTRLALFLAAGFSPELRDMAARSPGVVLVDAERLYRGA